MTEQITSLPATTNEQANPAPVTHEQIADEHHSPHIITGLGRAAVATRLEAADNDTGVVWRQMLESKYLPAELQSARDKLASLTSTQAAELETILVSQAWSPWLNELVGATSTTLQNPDTNKSALLIARLTEQTADGSYAVPDETFANFLEWHNHTLAQGQKELDTKTESLKELYRQKFNEAIAAGWVPPSLSSRLEERLAASVFILDDGLRTTLRNADGTHLEWDGRHEITYAPAVLAQPEKITLHHELTHALEGHGEENDELNENSSRPWHATGMYRLFMDYGGGDTGGTAINEAVVEHFASSLAHGAVDTTHVFAPERAGGLGTYYNERRLLDTLCTRGEKIIDIRDFLAAHFESTKEATRLGANSAQAKLAKQLKESFPEVDVIADIKAFSSETDVASYTKKLLNASFKRRKHERRQMLAKDPILFAKTYGLRPLAKE